MVDKWRGVYEHLWGEVTAGRYRDALPGVRLLAEELGVSIATVRRAIGELADQGVVTPVAGVGSLINPAAVLGDDDALDHAARRLDTAVDALGEASAALQAHLRTRRAARAEQQSVQVDAARGPATGIPDVEELAGILAAADQPGAPLRQAMRPRYVRMAQAVHSHLRATATGPVADAGGQGP